MTIDDPEGICRTAIGGDVTLFGVRSSAWDLDSPVCRPRTILRQPDEVAGGPDATNGNGSTSTVAPGHARVAGDIGTPVDFGGVAVADPASLEQSTTPQWVRQSSD